jgi:hypothetical protein
MAGLLACPNRRRPSRPDPDSYRDGTVAKVAVNMKDLQLRVQLRNSPIAIGVTGFPLVVNHFRCKVNNSETNSYLECF